jgi:hypothetical protein
MIVFLTIISCITTKDSPAPGCIQRIGCSPMGGCFGKPIIQDLQIENAPACLQVTVNNCNGGVINVDNTCEDRFTLGVDVVEPGDSMNFDIRQDGGEFSLIPVASNLSEFVPSSDQVVELYGKLGDQSVKISFTKTAPLCE